MENFSLVVAIDKNQGIGRNGGLPWKLPKDLAHFKEVTTQKHPSGHPNVVIMGRKTWESLPERFRPLPNRINIVLTKQKKYPVPQGVIIADDINFLDDKLKAIPHGFLYIIGGQQIFEAALADKRCTKLYLTEINAVYDCDTFFPPFKSRFKSTAVSSLINDGGVNLLFTEYQI